MSKIRIEIIEHEEEKKMMNSRICPNFSLLLTLSVIAVISTFLLTYQSTIVFATTEEGGDKTTRKDKDKKQKNPVTKRVFCAQNFLSWVSV
jgi:hypothetical protein